MPTDEKVFWAEEARYKGRCRGGVGGMYPIPCTDEKVFWAQEARRSLARSAFTCAG